MDHRNNMIMEITTIIIGKITTTISSNRHRILGHHKDDRLMDLHRDLDRMVHTMGHRKIDMDHHRVDMGHHKAHIMAIMMTVTEKITAITRIIMNLTKMSTIKWIKHITENM